MLNKILHILLLLLLPPLLQGIIIKTKAWFAGRNGPPLLQPYYDLIKMLQRQVVISQTTTWIFVAAPIISVMALLLAGMLIPLGSEDAPLSFTGDLILFAYLLALTRFFTVAAALDTGSPFEGMGSAREVTFACIAEPALFFAFLVLAKISGSLTLATMLHAPRIEFSVTVVAPLVLIAIGLFIVLLAEACRIPIDDPTTHLELTMVHEAMVLDHSGPLFGLILYGSALKLMILGSLFLHVILPFNFGHPGLDWLLCLAGLGLLALIIGIIESVMARLQIRRVSHLLSAALLFCAFGFILLIR